MHRASMYPHELARVCLSWATLACKRISWPIRAGTLVFMGCCLYFLKKPLVWESFLTRITMCVLPYSLHISAKQYVLHYFQLFWYQGALVFDYNDIAADGVPELRSSCLDPDTHRDCACAIILAQTSMLP